MSITLVTADDQQMLLTLYKFLADELDMQILEECKSPESAVEAYSKHRPQVILLDIRFGGEISGFDVAREIIKKHADANVVFISQYVQASYIAEAYQIGAKAFLTKNCDPETFRVAVQAASEGRKYFMPELNEHAVQWVISSEINPRLLLQEKNQLEIFVLIAKGSSNQEAADKLGIDIRTVSLHRQKIQEKLKISRVQEYTRMAIAHGLLMP